MGAILAGGRARRFGSDKARAMFRGVALIDHVAAVIASQVDDVIVCGRVPGIVDRPSGAGPLGGIAAALHHGRDRGFDWLLSVPCDTPSLPDDLLCLLRAGADAAYLAGLPVVGLWPCSLADQLDRHLAQGGSRSVRGWADAIGARAVTLDREIPNINTRDDLAALG